MRLSGTLLALGVIPSLARAQGARVEQTDSGPRIVASATKVARVVADRAMVYGSVEATAETPAEAVQRGEHKVQAIMEAIRQVSAEGAAVVPYGLTPTGSINPYQPSGVPTTYTARFVVRVQSTRIDQVAGLAATLVTAGATSAVATQFEYSAADSVRRILYASALDQARRDAEALASALGGRLGQVLEATSNAPSVVPSGPPYVALSSSINVGGATPSPDVTVTATASVRYRFVAR